MKNTHEGVLLFVKLQALNGTKSHKASHILIAKTGNSRFPLTSFSVQDIEQYTISTLFADCHYEIIKWVN